MITAIIQAPEKVAKKTSAPKAERKLYPNFKVIVLNDDFNSFDHVSACLVKYIPDMSHERAWELTNQVHFEGMAIAWIGPQEQAELYHAQLKQEHLTMAPLESC